MTEKEYIESFGWSPEELTPSELKAVRDELRDIKRGYIILDSILTRKDFVPQKR